MQKCLESEVVVQQNSSTTSSCRTILLGRLATRPTFLATIEADSLSSWLYYSRISEGDGVDLKGSTLHFPILISEKKIKPINFYFLCVEQVIHATKFPQVF